MMKCMALRQRPVVRGIVVRGGFTLIELLVVIAIIAILAAILFPVFSHARAKAYQATCLSNTREIAMAVAMYTQDYDEVLPYAFIMDVYPGYSYYIRWWGLIHPYHKNWELYGCPADQQRITSNPWWSIPGLLPPYPRVFLSYGWNYPHMPYRPPAPGTPLSVYTYPSEAMVAVHSETIPTATWSKSYVYCPIHWPPGTLAWVPFQNVTDDHFEGTCAIHLDGHSKWYKQTRLIYGDYSSGSFLDRFWAHYVGYR